MTEKRNLEEFFIHELSLRRRILKYAPTTVGGSSAKSGALTALLGSLLLRTYRDAPALGFGEVRFASWANARNGSPDTTSVTNRSM
jgi:hypothetical protein